MDEVKTIKRFEAFGLNNDAGTDVFFNGRFIGFAREADAFVAYVREARRHGEFPPELGIRSKNEIGVISVSTEIGRVLMLVDCC